MSDKAYNVVNADSQKPLILTCEHASALIPDSYQNLGLDADCLNTHIARDKGCRELTLSLAEQLGVTAFIGGYSRLLIDLNRQENEKELIVQSSDGIDIPANKNLSDEEKEKRLKSYYYPYHRAIDDKIETLIKQGIKPRIFPFMHSPLSSGVEVIARGMPESCLTRKILMQRTFMQK